MATSHTSTPTDKADSTELVSTYTPTDDTAKSNATISHSTQSPGRSFLYRGGEFFNPRSTTSGLPDPVRDKRDSLSNLLRFVIFAQR